MSHLCLKVLAHGRRSVDSSGTHVLEAASQLSESNMKRSQSGFTLIELVVVIVIVGIMGAIAVPKFIDLSGEAQTAATKGVAGGLSSASAVNYSARKANPAKGVSVLNCTDVSSAMMDGLPAAYTITNQVVNPDTAATCSVIHIASGVTESFTALGTN